MSTTVLKSYKGLSLLLVCGTLLLILYSLPSSSFDTTFSGKKFTLEPYNFTNDNVFGNWRNLTDEEISKLSVLGRRLFLYEDIGKAKEQNFTIHVWKHYDAIALRFINRYTDHRYDPFENCSVRNCIFTSNDSEVLNADAVLFHVHKLENPPSNVPRTPDQLWVWLSDESPNAIFSLDGDHNKEHYSDIFNWSMTYRMDSDVPVPYGRAIPLYKNEKPDYIDFAAKDKGVVFLSSHCTGENGRHLYIKGLQDYLQFDFFGKCGTSVPCEGHYKKNCDILHEYKIYISFENNNCEDYITEKVWWNAFQKGNVPVVMGTTKENYKKILPPNSFIHVDDFYSPKELAVYIKFLLANPEALSKYHEWRKSFKIVNEHGYFGSPVFHFCRLCEALNYNSRADLPKNANLSPFFSSKEHCYPSKLIS